MEKLEDGDFLAFLFFLAIMAFDYAIILVHHMKQGRHRLVVGDALGIGAFYDAV